MAYSDLTQSHRVSARIIATQILSKQQKLCEVLAQDCLKCRIALRRLLLDTPNTQSDQSRAATVAKHPFRIGKDRQPALDLVSYGRRGPGRPDHFAPEQVAHIARTVRRAPEVMV